MRTNRDKKSKTTTARLVAATALLALVGSPREAMAQGCVAVRGGGLCSLNAAHGHDGEHAETLGKWQFSLSYRWLHSFRHFAGDQETRNAAGKTRVEAGTEVINDSHFVDLGLSYQISPRYSASVVLPFVYSDRSSLYEHTAGGRHSTQAGGLADARLAFSAWLWNPESMPKGNIQLGLGLKLPTGDYEATDTYQTARGPEEHYVDQSIQPGDGGWGFTAEMFAYRQLTDRLSVYGQAYYLFSPEGVNGVSSRASNVRGKTYQRLLNDVAAGTAGAAGRLAAARALGYDNFRSLEDQMSITDQYLGRAGVSFLMVKKIGLALSLGTRLEGVPAEDVIGNSDGFRRPGYAVSIEPGISMMHGRYSASILAPVALYRNRVASVADERWGQIVGTGTQPGDAAYADYVITATFGIRF